jgi:protein tyrosine phosphatase (PTP) superfamily phosphohydrolase (DUF442 family)
MSLQALEEITNFLRISDAIGTAGQPTAAQFAAIKAAGYEVVMNLAMPDSTNALPNEGELVAEQAMDYVHIPVVWERPTIRDLEQFFEAMDRYRGKRVFVHCALNMRVSVFVCLYRVLRENTPFEVASEAIHKIWEPDAVWESFLHQAVRERV